MYQNIRQQVAGFSSVIDTDVSREELAAYTASAYTLGTADTITGAFSSFAVEPSSEDYDAEEHLQAANLLGSLELTKFISGRYLPANKRQRQQENLLQLLSISPFFGVDDGAGGTYSVEENISRGVLDIGPQFNNVANTFRVFTQPDIQTLHDLVQPNENTLADLLPLTEVPATVE
jgi:hypothetical protein